MAGADAAVAIYWDFENVHACMVDDAEGDGAYRSTRFKPQEPVVDTDPVMEYAATFGRVVVHRAYANWQYFGRYRDELQAHAIDLVQLFPLAGSKNGADIRLVLDVIEDMQHHPHLTHVLVVASDSDYTSLAQRCRKHGLYFLGVGTERTAGSYQFACDEFRRYRDLAGASAVARAARPADSADREVAGVEDAADLVVRAIRRLAAGSGESWVRKAGVRPLVKRLDPTFDESGFGFPTFTELLKALEDAGYVCERAGEHDHELAVHADLNRPDSEAGSWERAELDGPGRAGASAIDEGRRAAPGYPGPPGLAAVPRIERQLRRRGLRLPTDRRILWEIPELMVRTFVASPDQTATSFDSLRFSVEAAALELGLTVTEAEFNKVKSILLHARAFTLLGRDRGISLQVADTAHLRFLIVGQLLRHLADPADEDPRMLAEAFFGPSASDDQRDLVAAVLRMTPADPGPAGQPPASQPPGGHAPAGPSSAGPSSAGPASAGPASEAQGCARQAPASQPPAGQAPASQVVPDSQLAAEPLPAVPAPREGRVQPVAFGPAPAEKSVS
jgi:hypothetical protein